MTERKVEEIRETVRASYAQRALKVAGSGCCSGGSCDPISRDLYGEAEAGAVPADALAASLGCGNPTALADLRPGETVLDLGSGGGIDVLLSARRVGPGGFAYGVDMTDEMLALAERNRAAAGAANVRFLKGTIEEIPLPAASVDVVISNCVVNLSGDKARVIREAFRVLRPGGRFAVSDVLVQGSIPPVLRRDMEAWAGCIAGAMEEGEIRAALGAAGFEGIEVQVTRVYDAAEIPAAAAGAGRFVAAFVRARKPRA